MTTVLVLVGLGLIGWGLWQLERAVRRLLTLVTGQALRIAQLERDVKEAKVLARKRLAGGRSGR